MSTGTFGINAQSTSIKNPPAPATQPKPKKKKIDFKAGAELSSQV